MTALASERVLVDGYEDIRVCQGPRSGLTMAIAVHRTVNGRSLGGCRFEPYATPDDALYDVKRLARSMTFKAAVAGLGLGGAKGVIAYEPGPAPEGEHRYDALQDFAELVESFEGRYITAQDAGTSLDDIVRIGEFTDYIAGRPIAEGGAGDPSSYTARGVEAGIRASLHAPLGQCHVVIVGLGHVGSDLARRLDRAGARLTVADVDVHKRELAEELGAAWVSSAEALVTKADLFAPCALGGALDADTIEGLQVPVVAGAANNQLADATGADMLSRRGIVWAPDFVINAGGLIAVADELHGFDELRVERAIRGIGETLTEIYARAAAAGTNTLTAAEGLAVERSGGI
jgi:leucine dehydrogenase